MSDELRQAQILVVDDEDDMCWALSMIIELDDHRCVAVRSAAEALATIGNRSFDLAFVDVKLPDMEGLELVERIRQISPELPCVLVSGFFYGDDGPVQDTLARGLVVGFISKPFMVEQIQETILANIPGPSHARAEIHNDQSHGKRDRDTTE